MNKEKNIQNGKPLFESMATEILAGANVGLWYVIFDEGEPKLVADENMLKLIGISNPMSEEEAYKFWYERIDNIYKPQVAVSISMMKTGMSTEITYPYHHPEKGIVTIRCGGNVHKDYAGDGVMIQGYHQDVTEYNKKIYEKESINMSIANIYDSMHVLDIENDSFEEFGAHDAIRGFLRSHVGLGAQHTLWGVLRERISEPHYRMIKEFVDLSTLAERMENKNYLQIEAINIDNRWFRFGFIRIDNKEDELLRVIFVSQDIDAEKRREENLIMISNTDNLTGLLNRHAYNKYVDSIQNDQIGNDLWYMGIDLNGLKTVNDTYGHKAGDDLICGAADCLKAAFESLGQIYRMGGDEFLVVLRGSDADVERTVHNLDDCCKKWRGEHVKEMSLSKGIVCSKEIENCTIGKLERVSDDRMYAEKKAYHKLLENIQ